jgi:hypothetical protein
MENSDHIYIHHNNDNIHSNIHNNNTSSNDELSLQVHNSILFYFIIIVFSILLVAQFIALFYYCCMQINNPYKRLQRRNGIMIKMGTMTHELDNEEKKKMEELENNETIEEIVV